MKIKIYIDAVALLENIKEKFCNSSEKKTFVSSDDILKIVSEMPPEKVSPRRKHAKWVNGWCSNCGHAKAAATVYDDYLANFEQRYCYYCGAEMDEKEVYHNL